MREQWRQVPPALVFVHIPVSPCSALESHVEVSWIRAGTEGGYSGTVVCAFLSFPIAARALMSRRPSVGDHDDEPDPATQGFLNDTYTGLDLPCASSAISIASLNQ